MFQPAICPCGRAFRTRSNAPQGLCKTCRQVHKYRTDAARREQLKAQVRAARQTRKDHVRAIARASHARNRVARNATSRAYYQLHKARLVADTKTPEAQAARKANKQRQKLRRYGLTAVQFAAMATAQQGLCALCKRPPGAKGLAIDHCHHTGHVRALLCGPCNTGLGLFREDAALLEAAANYVKPQPASGKT